MASLYLIAEGQTEQTFADLVLKPHLADRQVYVFAMLVAHGKRKGKVHRGGVLKYATVKNDIGRLLSQHKGPDKFFTTMIDLYRLPSDFPAFAEAENLRHIPQKRVEALEQAFASDIGDPRFIPYIQLHEFEAYLFSDPTCFAFSYDHHEKQIAALQAIAEGHATPELIDDGPHSAPSKRIAAQFPDYEDAKPVFGPQIAILIGLATIRAKCSHFAAWVSRLESLSLPKV
jgi:hypothetical protein